MESHLRKCLFPILRKRKPIILKSQNAVNERTDWSTFEENLRSKPKIWADICIKQRIKITNQWFKPTSKKIWKYKFWNIWWGRTRKDGIVLQSESHKNLQREGEEGSLERHDETKVRI